MILLTGASGFIGKHLLPALIKEFGKDKVAVLTSEPVKGCSFLLHNNYNFPEDYFIKTNWGSSIQTIIHAGAFTPKNGKQANDWEKCNSNIFNTAKLLSASLPDLKNFIYLSTLDVYGPDEIISETSLTQPVSLYGESKLYSEKIVTAWADANKKNHQILRVGHVYGPGEEAYQKIIPITIKKLLQQQPLQIWGTGKEVRSFIYIKDIVRAILNAVKLQSNIGPVNLVSNHKITISELVNKLIAISGRTSTIEMMPATFSGRDLVFDNSKMKKYLLDNETLLDEGLREEWEYMKASVI